MKKKQAASERTPWDITESMFLSEQETHALVSSLQQAVNHAAGEEKIRALVDQLIIEILLYSGIRNSELCRLCVDDTEAVHGRSYLRIVETLNEVRLVYLPRMLSRQIVDFVQGPRRDLIAETDGKNKASGVLIPNERGRPYDRTSLYRRVVRILKSAGLDDRASVQLLRHTYGYLAYKRSNGNLLFVQQQLGHSHPMVTSVYAQFVHFSYPDLADSVGEPDLNTPSIQPPSKAALSSKRKS